MKTYNVSHTITITYTRRIQANTAKEAKAIAEDMGDYGADDQSLETPWRAKLIKELDIVPKITDAQRERTEGRQQRYMNRAFPAKECGRK